MTKAAYIFTDIYDALVVNHHLNKSFSVDCKLLNEQTILQLKRILKEEDIEYQMKNDAITCWLNNKSLEIAKKTYTGKERQKLDEKEKLLHRSFMKESLIVYDDSNLRKRQ